MQEDQSQAIRIDPQGQITSARRRLSSICSLVKRAETFRIRAALHGIIEGGGEDGGRMGGGLVFGIKYQENSFRERRKWMSELRYASPLSYENENYGRAARHAVRKMMSRGTNGRGGE